MSLVASQHLRTPRSSAATARRALAGVSLVLGSVVSLATPALATDATPTPGPTSRPSVAADSARVTFGVQPATPDAHGVVAPDSRPFLYYAASSGSTITDRVAIVNYSVAPITLTVYSTDALNNDQGGFALLPGDEKPSGAGSWTSIASARVTVTVPGRSRSATGQEQYGFRVVPFTVRVPATATPGDHVGGIVASLVSADTSSGPNVRLDQRVGTRMFIRVAGALDPRLAVENLSATYHGSLNPFGRGSASVTFTVANRGNVKLGGRVSVNVSGLLGRSATATVPDLPLILPGNLVDVSVEVPEVLPQFRDTATVTLTPLKLQGDADPDLPDVVATTSFWAIPWPLIALVLLLLASVWYVARRRRHGTATDVVDASPRHSVPVA